MAGGFHAGRQIECKADGRESFHDIASISGGVSQIVSFWRRLGQYSSRVLRVADVARFAGVVRREQQQWPRRQSNQITPLEMRFPRGSANGSKKPGIAIRESFDLYFGEMVAFFHFWWVGGMRKNDRVWRENYIWLGLCSIAANI